MSDTVDLFDNSDHAEFDVPVFGVPKASRAMRLEKQEVARQARLKANLKRSAEKRRTSYGGGDWQAFKREIRARDGNLCQWCRKSNCMPVDVHHVRERSQMGGSKKVSVNYPENAICLGRLCHALADEYRIKPEELEGILTAKHGYVYEAK